MDAVHWPNESHASLPPVFSEMHFSGGAWHWPCSETQVALSRGVPGSHYQIVTQTPSALSGGFSCSKGRESTRGVLSFLSLAT